VITCLGSATAWVASVARIPFVVGVDNYLPKAFGRLHPKYGTPVTALLVQAAITMVFAAMGQAGTSVKGAYDVLVSLMVIAEMLPYMLLFSATIRLLWCESPGSNVRSLVQRGAVIGTAVLGLVTTFGAIGFATLPRPDEPHPALAVAKTVGMTGVMIGIGIGLYWRGARRARRAERVAEGCCADAASSQQR